MSTMTKHTITPGFERIPATEWMHGYRLTQDGRVIEVVRCESGRWTVFVTDRWGTVSQEGLSFQRAMALGRRYARTESDR